MKLSVAICSYNPNIHYLDQVLESLKQQSLARDQWELVLIDNNSNNPIAELIDLSWHSNARICIESQQGLTNARIRSVIESQGEIMVCVDDDNILQVDYLAKALRFMRANPQVGAIGGKALPVWEQAPPDWFYGLGLSLGCRDLGDQLMITQQKGKPLQHYPDFAPIGTGMVIRKAAFEVYVQAVQNDPIRRALGRTGTALISGEDNDMMLTLLKNGWELAYYPELVVRHLMPAARVEPAYLAKMAFESNKSWGQVLAIHNISPWQTIPQWTLILRKIKAYLNYRPWKSPANYIRWKGACGHFEGRIRRSSNI